MVARGPGDPWATGESSINRIARDSAVHEQRPRWPSFNAAKQVDSALVQGLISKKQTVHGRRDMGMYVERHLRENPILRQVREHANSMGDLIALQSSGFSRRSLVNGCRAVARHAGLAGQADSPDPEGTTAEHTCKSNVPFIPRH